MYNEELNLYILLYSNFEIGLLLLFIETYYVLYLNRGTLFKFQFQN